MPELDGFAVLRTVADHPETFAGLDAAAAKTARGLVVQRLKSKTLTVDEARAVRDALGDDAFDMIIEGVPAATLKAIVSKLDKHHPKLKGSSSAWQRQHLRSLLDGAEPAQKATQSNKAGAAAKAGATTPIGFKTEAMRVFRESLKRK